MLVVNEFEDRNKGTISKVACNNCGIETNHKIMKDLRVNEDQEIYSDGYHCATVSSVDDYQILKCNGCSAMSFRHCSWFSEHTDFTSDGSTEALYPKRTKNDAPLNDFKNIPAELEKIYKEMINCFNNECYILTAAGLRALVEGICSYLKIKEGPVERDGKATTKSTLEGKIGGLSERGVLTSQSAEILHEHRFIGNGALHELSQPSTDELMLAIEIIEHTIKSVFEMPQTHQDLKNKREKRRTNPCTAQR